MKRKLKNKNSIDTVRKFWGECVCSSYPCACEGFQQENYVSIMVDHSWLQTQRVAFQYGGGGVSSIGDTDI